MTISLDSDAKAAVPAKQGAAPGPELPGTGSAKPGTGPPHTSKARNMLRRVGQPVRRIWAVIRRFLATLENALAGSEERRFVVGSILVPLAIAVIGASVVARYQDWQDRRSRVRDAIESLRTAGASLGIDLEKLAQKGVELESILTNQDTAEEEMAVEGSLALIEGRVQVIARQSKEGRVLGDRLSAQLAACRKTVDDYVTCLADTLPHADRNLDSPLCTPRFREAMADPKSCKSLEMSTYSIDL